MRMRALLSFYFYGPFILVDGYEGEFSGDGFVALIRVHLFDVDIHANLQARSTEVDDFSLQFGNGACWDRLFEVDAIA